MASSKTGDHMGTKFSAFVGDPQRKTNDKILGESEEGILRGSGEKNMTPYLPFGDGAEFFRDRAI